jgi:phosphate transport system substrate-binding protein
LPTIPDDLRYSLTDGSGPDSYPVSGTVWAVLLENQPAGRGQFLAEFLRWATHEGQQYAAGLHYAPLPAGLVERVEQKLARVRIGGVP